MSRKYDHLSDVETFVTVVERGSLTAAAVAMSTTPSVISRALARLEARLGTQLLRRTTRSLAWMLVASGTAHLSDRRRSRHVEQFVTNHGYGHKLWVCSRRRIRADDPVDRHP